MMTNKKLKSMCNGWPISKDVCSTGIQQFQKLAATIIELYVQPLIAFVVFNAFLQLTVMVLAILDHLHCVFSVQNVWAQSVKLDLVKIDERNNYCYFCCVCNYLLLYYSVYRLIV